MIHRIFFIILAISILVLVSKSPSQPFSLSEDMAFESSYKKTAEVNEKNLDYGFTQYASRTTSLLSETKDDDLLGFKCSDSFVRSNQGLYLLENTKTANRSKKRIQNKEFIEYMRNKDRTIPKGKKILSGKICELENQTILLFYSIGEYDNKSSDKARPADVILYSHNNQAFIEILPRGLFVRSSSLETASSKDHMRCDQIFQINRKQKLLIMCEEASDWISNYFTYHVDLRSGKIEVLESCMNKFEKKLEIVCN
ncbi:MAG TPA: hypothetical protein VNA13_03530 [Xanthomonadales bacterium]|nr:hypothetical protein [Xanthomonadales bacterium]